MKTIINKKKLKQVFGYKKKRGYIPKLVFGYENKRWLIPKHQFGNIQLEMKIIINKKIPKLVFGNEKKREAHSQTPVWE
jgi:hypothetical protein